MAVDLGLDLYLDMLGVYWRCRSGWWLLVLARLRSRRCQSPLLWSDRQLSSIFLAMVHFFGAGASLGFVFGYNGNLVDVEP